MHFSALSHIYADLESFCSNSISNFRSDVGESTPLTFDVDAQKLLKGNPRGSNEINKDETKRLVISAIADYIIKTIRES